MIDLNRLKAARKTLAFIEHNFPDDLKRFMKQPQHHFDLPDSASLYSDDLTSMSGWVDLLEISRDARKAITNQRVLLKSNSPSTKWTKAIPSWSRGRAMEVKFGNIAAATHWQHQIIADELAVAARLWLSNRRFDTSITCSRDWDIRWGETARYNRSVKVRLNLNVRAAGVIGALHDKAYDGPLTNIAIATDGAFIIGVFDKMDLEEHGELRNVLLRHCAWIKKKEDIIHFGWVAIKKFERQTIVGMDADFEKAIHKMRLRIRRHMNAVG